MSIDLNKLMSLLMSDDLDSLKSLIENSGEKQHEYLLELAVYSVISGNLQLMKLIDGIDITNVVDHKGRNLWFYALFNFNSSILQYLANQFPIGYYHVDDQFHTSLDLFKRQFKNNGEKNIFEIHIKKMFDVYIKHHNMFIEKFSMNELLSPYEVANMLTEYDLTLVLEEDGERAYTDDAVGEISRNNGYNPVLIKSNDSEISIFGSWANSQWRRTKLDSYESLFSKLPFPTNSFFKDKSEPVNLKATNIGEGIYKEITSKKGHSKLSIVDEYLLKAIVLSKYIPSNFDFLIEYKIPYPFLGGKEIKTCFYKVNDYHEECGFKFIYLVPDGSDDKDMTVLVKLNDTYASAGQLVERWDDYFKIDFVKYFNTLPEGKKSGIFKPIFCRGDIKTISIIGDGLAGKVVQELAVIFLNIFNKKEENVARIDELQNLSLYFFTINSPGVSSKTNKEFIEMANSEFKKLRDNKIKISIYHQVRKYDIVSLLGDIHLFESEKSSKVITLKKAIINSDLEEKEWVSSLPEASQFSWFHHSYFFEKSREKVVDNFPPKIHFPHENFYNSEATVAEVLSNRILLNDIISEAYDSKYITRVEYDKKPKIPRFPFESIIHKKEYESIKNIRRGAINKNHLKDDYHEHFKKIFFEYLSVSLPEKKKENIKILWQVDGLQLIFIKPEKVIEHSKPIRELFFSFYHDEMNTSKLDEIDFVTLYLPSILLCFLSELPSYGLNSAENVIKIFIGGSGETSLYSQLLGVYLTCCLACLCDGEQHLASLKKNISELLDKAKDNCIPRSFFALYALIKKVASSNEDDNGSLIAAIFKQIKGLNIIFVAVDPIPINKIFNQLAYQLTDAFKQHVTLLSFYSFSKNTLALNSSSNSREYFLFDRRLNEGAFNSINKYFNKPTQNNHHIVKQLDRHPVAQSPNSGTGNLADLQPNTNDNNAQSPDPETQASAAPADHVMRDNSANSKKPEAAISAPTPNNTPNVQSHSLVTDNPVRFSQSKAVYVEKEKYKITMFWRNIFDEEKQKSIAELLNRHSDNCKSKDQIRQGNNRINVLCFEESVFYFNDLISDLSDILGYKISELIPNDISFKNEEYLCVSENNVFINWGRLSAKEKNDIKQKLDSFVSDYIDKDKIVYSHNNYVLTINFEESIYLDMLLSELGGALKKEVGVISLQETTGVTYAGPFHD